MGIENSLFEKQSLVKSFSETNDIINRGGRYCSVCWKNLQNIERGIWGVIKKINLRLMEWGRNASLGGSMV